MNQEHSHRPASRESGIVQRVRVALRTLPFKQPHVLLACSGGKDSVALAHILSDLNRLELITPSIAHIHHGKHDQADFAAMAVQSIGRLLDIPVTVHKLDASAIESHEGVGLEEALRRERYLALAAIATDIRADCIAVAHHETDQAETVLLHLLRGTGLDGLAGMREWELRDVPWWTSSKDATEIGIWRPLLNESANVVAEIARESGLPIAEDPTNSDTTFRRNAIRHELLPVIERIAPGSTTSIARAADLIAGDAEYLHQLTDEHFANLRDGVGIRRDRLVALPVAMQRRVVRTWLLASQPHLELGFERITAVIQISHRNRGGAQVELGAGVTVELRDGVLVLNPWQNRGD